MHAHRRILHNLLCMGLTGRLTLAALATLILWAVVFWALN